jgi:hypothetical protein
MPKIKPVSAFTLVEIAIVMILIGLILGGVVVGSSLIRTATLNSIISDVEKYKLSINTFKQKYRCLPGDCSNATQFFGLDAGACDIGTTPTGTCNGDGNSKIGSLGVDDESREPFLAWQQLGLSGLIAGTFSGTPESSPGGDDRASAVGWNVPASPIRNAGYLMVYLNLPEPLYSTMNISDRWNSMGHWVLFGDPKTDPYTTIMDWYEPSGPAISAMDAYSIDSKIDDGAPNTGNVKTIYTDTPGMGTEECVNTATTPYSYFALQSTACSLQFNAGI